MPHRIRSNNPGGGNVTIVISGGGQGFELSQGDQTESMALSVEQELSSGAELQVDSVGFDPTIDLGSENHSQILALQAIDFGMGAEAQVLSLGLVQTFDHGQENQQLTKIETDVTTPSGGETHALGVQPVLAVEASQATETQALSKVTAVQSFSEGSEASSMSASAIVLLDDYVSSTAAVDNSGSSSNTWASIANAQGTFDGSNATLDVAPGTLATASGDVTLKCSGLIITTPSGFTRTGANVLVRHLWTGAIALPTSSAVFTLELWDSAGTTLLQTLRTITIGTDANQATLTTETFDVSGSVTDSILAAGVQVWAHAVWSTLVGLTGDNCHWAIDGCAIESQVEITGIT